MSSLEDTESPKKKQRLNSSPPPPPQFKCSFRTHTCPEILKHGVDYTELELREGALNHNQPEGVIYDTPVCGETVDGHIFCFWCDSEARQGGCTGGPSCRSRRRRPFLQESCDSDDRPRLQNLGLAGIFLLDLCPSIDRSFFSPEIDRVFFSPKRLGLESPQKKLFFTQDVNNNNNKKCTATGCASRET